MTNFILTQDNNWANRYNKRSVSVDSATLTKLLDDYFKRTHGRIEPLEPYDTLFAEFKASGSTEHDAFINWVIDGYSDGSDSSIKTYTIDYNNGFSIDVVGTIGRAKVRALDYAGYAQQPIYIHDTTSDEVVAVSHWYEANGKEIDEDNALLVIGSSGYYAHWIDGGDEQ